MTKLDTLPTSTVSSNYQDEEAIDLVTKGVNTQIDENQKQLNAHFDSLIKTYNHLNKRAANRPEEFLNTLKQGKQTKEDLQEFQKYWSNYFDYANRLQDHKETIDQVQWAHYPNKGDFDKDVKNEIDNQPIISQVRAQSNDFAGQLQNEGSDEDAHN